MTPLLFGDSSSPLFGVLHEPPSGAELGRGVLICPPIAQEHIRTHWALRQVATALARAGYHVLRFDWYGVGDSAGDLADGSIARWIEDARTAAQELRDAAGLRKIAIVGLRFGATLAALAARRLKPTTLVLWDPITRGEDYLSGLSDLHARLVVEPNRFWCRWPERVRATVGQVIPAITHVRPRAPEEYVGFRFGAPLLREIASIEESAFSDVGSARVVVVDSDPRRDLAAFAVRLKERTPKVEHRATDVRGRWDEIWQIEEHLLPADAVRIIADAVEGRDA